MTEHHRTIVTHACLAANITPNELATGSGRRVALTRFYCASLLRMAGCSQRETAEACGYRDPSTASNNSNTHRSRCAGFNELVEQRRKELDAVWCILATRWEAEDERMLDDRNRVKKRLASRR